MAGSKVDVRLSGERRREKVALPYRNNLKEENFFTCLILIYIITCLIIINIMTHLGSV